MNKPASSFVAGLLTGIALTAGVAAAVVRLSAGDGPAHSSADAVSLDTITARSLRLAHGLDTEHPVHLVHLGLQRFAEIISDRTGGRISVVIFPNGELGDETVTIEQLQSGNLDFAKASSAPLGSFSPDFAVFSVPYAFRDAGHCFAALDSSGAAWVG